MIDVERAAVIQKTKGSIPLNSLKLKYPSREHSFPQMNSINKLYL